MNVPNEWFHLFVAIVLGFLVHRLEKRLDRLEAIERDMVAVKTVLHLP